MAVCNVIQFFCVAEQILNVTAYYSSFYATVWIFLFNFNDFRKTICLHLTTYIGNTYYAGRQNNRLLGFIRQLQELQFCFSLYK